MSHRTINLSLQDVERKHIPTDAIKKQGPGAQCMIIDYRKAEKHGNMASIISHVTKTISLTNLLAGAFNPISSKHLQ